jgi:alkylation response protein AidB-like acyl-CoA dehydrogenase
MDLEKILHEAHKIAAEVASKETAEVDSKAKWPEKSMQALKETKLTALVAPKEYGGHRQDLYGLVRVGEILGEACA